jgi:uncharacterized membrane protein YoaK (UPF0700 family)
VKSFYVIAAGASLTGGLTYVIAGKANLGLLAVCEFLFIVAATTLIRKIFKRSISPYFLSVAAALIVVAVSLSTDVGVNS